MNDLLKFIATRNTAQSKRVSGGLVKIIDDIYTPSYNAKSSPSYLKEKSEIWIKKDDETYNVYHLKRDTNESELSIYLRE